MTAPPHVLNYDPRAHGARCDACPLSTANRVMVPPEIRHGVSMLIVGMEPGQQEERDGRPFVGPSGVELERTLSLCGISRSQVSITNARLCRYKKSDPRAWDKQSLECCKPRVVREIQQHASMLLLGASPLTQLYGTSSDYLDAEKGDEASEENDEDDRDPDEKFQGEGAISKLRGYPLRICDRPALATWHPAHVLRTRRWTECFRWDVAKAFRYAAGRLDWEDPTIVLNPSIDDLDAAMSRWAARNEPVACDTETVGADGMSKEVPDPETCKVRCVGLGSRDHVVVVPFLSITGSLTSLKWDGGRFVGMAIERDRARERIRNFLDYLGSKRLLTGHNINVYDRPVMRRYGMPLPDYHRTFDTVIADHVWDSEFPHNLDFLSSRRTDAPKHKPGHKYQWKSDRELHFYCGMDCAVSAILAPIEHRGVANTDQQQVYKSDVELQKLSVGMHATGIYVDRAERERHRIRLQKSKGEAEARALKFAGRKISLGSHEQIRDFLYYERGLRWPSIETASGKPSTSRNAIHELLAQALPVDIEGFLAALLDFRRADKAINTFVNGAEPGRDGRVHPSWSPHTVVTGRLAARDPGVQQIPDRKNDLDSLRSMYCAEPGNVLVAADKEQLELRLVAAISGDERWIQAFLEGRDVHVMNAADFFLTSESSISKSQRDFAKTLCYMFLYSGGAETAMRNMWMVRDPATGLRKFARFTLTEAKLMRKNLLKKHPALPEWWERTLKDFRAKHYLETLILGRKRFFKDSLFAAREEEDRNEIINYRIQGTGGDLMGGSGASGRLMQILPWGLWGPGINFHGHDSLMVEVHARHEEKARRALEEAMTDELVTEYCRMPLPAKAKSGTRWSELG